MQRRANPLWGTVMRKGKNLKVKHVVLTGAGYTANFGGPTSEEMFEIVFNDKYIQNDKKLFKKIKDIIQDYDEYNFEIIYRHLNKSQKNIF